MHFYFFGLFFRKLCWVVTSQGFSFTQYHLLPWMKWRWICWYHAWVCFVSIEKFELSNMLGLSPVPSKQQKWYLWEQPCVLLLLYQYSQCNEAVLLKKKRKQEKNWGALQIKNDNKKWCAAGCASLLFGCCHLQPSEPSCKVLAFWVSWNCPGVIEMVSFTLALPFSLNIWRLLLAVK